MTFLKRTFGNQDRKKDKGVQGGSCNKSHCQKSNSAHHYVEHMRSWYCAECAAALIAEHNNTMEGEAA